MSDLTDYHRGYTPALPSQTVPGTGTNQVLFRTPTGLQYHADIKIADDFGTGHLILGAASNTSGISLTGKASNSVGGDCRISSADNYLTLSATSTTSGYDGNFALDMAGQSVFRVDLSAPGDSSSLVLDATGGITWRGYDIWHAGHMGAGSNLDSDYLDGQHGNYYTNPANLSAPVPITKGGLGDSVSTPSWPDHTLAFFDAPNSRFAPTTYLQFDSSNQKLTHADTTTGVYQRYISNFKGSLQVVHSFTDGVNISTLIQSGSAFSFDKPVTISANATLSGALTVAPAASVTQTTNKSTAVTANSEKVFITTSGVALSANTTVNFTLNNSAILSTDDMIFVTHHAGGTRGSYNIQAGATGVGTAQISIRNVSHFSLSETLQLRVWVLH